MKRWLFNLAVFAVFFSLIVVSIVYLVPPVNETGDRAWGWTFLLLGVVFLAVLCWTSFVLTAIGAVRPDHKLPTLLVRGTLFHSFLAALGVTGWLGMRLVGATGLFQVGLWCIILLSLEWMVRKSVKGED